MVEELLVIRQDFAREAGWQLLDRLDARGMHIEAAFWRFNPDSERWRLYLATPLVKTQGLFKTYMEMRAALDTIPEEEREGLQLPDISAVEPDFAPVIEMRRRYGSFSGKRGQQVRRMSVTETEPFIYRL